MKEKLIIVDNYKIHITYPITNNPIPLIVFITTSSLKNIYNNKYVLLEIENIKWTKDLTPWPYKNYEGEEDKFLNVLTTIIIPKVLEYLTSINISISFKALGGYSLGGLFAITSSMNSNIFNRIISVSGSLWYPNIVEYITSIKIPYYIESVYFSLGTKEKISKDKLFKQVEDNTISIYNYYKDNIKTKFEYNEGGHFQDELKRISKGIEWTLSF